MPVHARPNTKPNWATSDRRCAANVNATVVTILSVQLAATNAETRGWQRHRFNASSKPTVQTTNIGVSFIKSRSRSSIGNEVAIGPNSVISQQIVHGIVHD